MKITFESFLTHKRQRKLITKPFTGGELMSKLKKMGFIENNDGYNIRVIINGDGSEMDRTFDINICDPDDVAVMGTNMYGENIENQEIFFKDIEYILQDLNK